MATLIVIAVNFIWEWTTGKSMYACSIYWSGQYGNHRAYNGLERGYSV